MHADCKHNANCVDMQALPRFSYCASDKIWAFNIGLGTRLVTYWRWEL